MCCPCALHTQVRAAFKKHSSLNLSTLTLDEAKAALKELLGKPDEEVCAQEEREMTSPTSCPPVPYPRSVPVPLPCAQCEALIKKYNYDGDAHLDLPEFEALHADVFEKDAIGRLFRRHDSDGDHRLTMSETVRAMGEMVGRKSSRNLVGQFGDVDVDGNAEV